MTCDISDLCKFVDSVLENSCEWQQNYLELKLEKRDCRHQPLGSKDFDGTVTNWGLFIEYKGFNHPVSKFSNYLAMLIENFLISKQFKCRYLDPGISICNGNIAVSITIAVPSEEI